FFVQHWLNYRFWSAIVLAGLLGMPTTHLAAQTPTPKAVLAAPAKPASKFTPRLQLLAQSTQLLRATAQAQALALGLPATGPGSLLKNAQGQLLIYLYTDDLSPANLNAIRVAGASVEHVSAEYHVVTVHVDAANLNALANIGAVKRMREELQPVVQGNGIAPLARRTSAPAACNPVISEGDTQLNASAARSIYGVDGTGIKVGVLSDSFDKLGGSDTFTTDVASGELPGSTNPCGRYTNVTVISETLDATGTDEGRAMAQIVHDLAPGAQLGYATAFNGLYEFASNIRALRAWGADIIVDDVYYLDEPLFQDGPVAVAISDVVGTGAMYFTSAGNGNHIVSGQNVGSYEAAAYRPVTCPNDVLVYALGDCHNFNQSGTSNTDQVTIPGNGKIDVDLQWNEPWNGVQTDFDLYLLDSAGTVVVSSTFNSLTFQEPIEYLAYENPSSSSQTYQIVVNRYSGTATPRIKFFFSQQTAGITWIQFGATTGSDTVGPAITGHSASKYPMSVAAVPYNSMTTPEDYSSRGPAVHYYGPVLGSTAAPGITPETIQQPDFTATDGGCTSFFGNLMGCYRFYGTSAAAPHAAAVAALALQEARLLHISYNQASMRSLLKT
ncbi:MAG TPA: S8 family serine peptidase, partial [Anaerolineae bacterium]